MKEISKTLHETPKTTLTGVAYKQEDKVRQEESITRDEEMDQLPAFRISGVAKK